MIEYFKHHPSKLYTRIFLAVGFMIFIGVYSYLLKMFQGFSFSVEEYNGVWLSFDPQRFRTLFNSVVQDGQDSAFLNVFKFNILSISAFMLAFYSLSLMIARQIESTSRLYKIAYVFPVFPILIGLLDIIPSALILTCTSALTAFPNWLAYIISGSYVIRVLLLYILLIWTVLMLIWIVVRKFRRIQ